MTRIGLISDTHGFLDEHVFKHFEIVMRYGMPGDFGSIEIATYLAATSGLTVRGVFGNIDGNDIKAVYPEQLVFMCEGVKVMIRHIGGSPPNYNPETRKELLLQSAATIHQWSFPYFKSDV